MFAIAKSAERVGAKMPAFNVQRSFLRRAVRFQGKLFGLRLAIRNRIRERTRWRFHIDIRLNTCGYESLLVSPFPLDRREIQVRSISKDGAVFQ